MVAILVTGMSGTGKSTVLAGLAARGFAVVDTDYGDYSVERPATSECPAQQLWREDRIEELLSRHEASHGAALFVAGCVANQGRFHPRFDAIVLLSAPVDVLLQRLVRWTTNDFGKTPEGRSRVRADLTAVEPLLRTAADVEIDTRRPLPDVVGQLVGLADEVVMSRRP